MTRPHLDHSLFRRACGKFATGVTIVTTLDAEGHPQGMTANSFTSVSLEPPLVLFCVDVAANIRADFEAASHFAVSVLERSQEALSNRFAFRAGDRFDGIRWEAGPAGMPLIPGAIASFVCEVRQCIPAGDHVVILGQVFAANTAPGEPLLYFGSAYASIGPAGGPVIDRPDLEEHTAEAAES